MFCYLLLLHFVSDFLLQNRLVATKKSSDFWYMFIHCFIIFCIFYLGLYFSSYSYGNMVLFCYSYVLIHFIQDTFVWRGYKWIITKKLGNKVKDFKYWEESSFYSTIGFDQMLHTITLYCLWRLFL